MSNKKPIMTLQDYLDEEAKKLSAMSDEELKEYNNKIKEVAKDAKEKGIKTISFEELLDSNEEIPYITLDNVQTFVQTHFNNFHFKHLSQDHKTSRFRKKIFFSAHPNDFAYLDELSKMVLSICDADIYYYDDFETNVNNNTFKQMLSQMDIFIIPVTNAYLDEKSRSKELEYPTACSYDIPVLFIDYCQDVNKFNSQFGAIELLLNNDTLLEKLKNALNKKIFNEDLYNKITNAFLSTIFISYRKKNIKDIQKLTNAIYNNQLLNGVSLWYDSYLSAGEDYNDEIKTMLTKSEIFLLVITPDLLEENNYVLKEEYPLARALNKDIVLWLAKEVDIKKLAALYDGILTYPYSNNLNDLQTIIYNKLEKTINNKNTTLDDKYHLALAYLYGINCEKNKTLACNLLIDCAEKLHYDALITLKDLYLTKNQTRWSIPIQLNYQHQAIDKIIGEFEKGNFTNIYPYWKLTSSFIATNIINHEYNLAKRYLEQLDKYIDKLSILPSEIATERARLYERLASIYYMNQEYDNALSAIQKAKDIILPIFDKDNIKLPYELLFTIYNYLLLIYHAQENYDCFSSTFQEAIKYINVIQDKNDTVKLAYYQMMASGISPLLRDGFYAKIINMAFYIVKGYIQLTPNDVVNDSLSQLCNDISIGAFNEKAFDIACNYSGSAVVIANKICYYPKAKKFYRLSNYLFNMANIHYQLGKYETAEKGFKNLLKICENNDFQNKDYMESLGANFYSQLLVDTNRYQESIDNYLKYIQKFETKDLNDENTINIIDYYQRIGIIYQKFLNDSPSAKSYFEKGLNCFSKLINKNNPTAINLKNNLLSLINNK